MTELLSLFLFKNTIMTAVKDYKFREGDDVAHIDNIHQKMTIFHIYTETIKISNGNIIEDNKKYFEKETRKIIRGVGCHWYETVRDEKIKLFKEHKFHTKELVPWVIAIQGIDVVLDYIEKRDSFKYINSNN